MASNNRKKTIKWIIIGCVLTIFTVFTLFVLWIILFLFGGPAKKSHDVKDYHEIFELQLGSSGGLIVFPEELSEGMSEIYFSYYFRDTWNIPTVSIFLQGTYTEEEYAKEVARLENTRKVYGGTERILLRDEEGKYPYPAYIAVENRSHGYEYALLTGDNQITYIFTVFFDREDVEFDTKYLPDDFMTDEGREFGSGYSIYEQRRDEMGISYDTTRDEYVEVILHHWERVEDSSFGVEVELDRQNREIIRQCEFHYYEPPKDISDVDTYDDESDDTFWEELKGYEFVDIELSKDRTTAIVTYLDNGEEKQWQMELTQYMPHKGKTDDV